MAKDKKSFILYCDQKSIFDQLPNEKAGELIKHIFSYVNDENPKTEDLIIKIAFAPIKQQFKRDLEKYEIIRQKNRENARKRWNKHNATAYDRMPSDAKHADNDNDNVNVNVNDTGNGIIKRKKVKKEKLDLVYPFTSDSFKKALKIWYEYKHEQHRFKFKSVASEQAFLKQISKDFKTDHEAIEAIEYSMANGYKGVFKPQLNNRTNGSKNNQVHYNEELKRKLIDNLTKQQ